jgi:hypothetical protein
MKIKISEIENHEITLPEEIDKEGFLGLLSRLNAIGKMISKDDAGELSNQGELKTGMGAMGSSIKVARKYNKLGLKRRSYHMNKEALTLLRGNRDIVVKLWKAYYKKDSEKKELWALVEKYGLKGLIKNVQALTSGSSLNIRNEHKISPNEVGLVRFTGRGEAIERLKNGN